MNNPSEEGKDKAAEGHLPMFAVFEVVWIRISESCLTTTFLER